MAHFILVRDVFHVQRFSVDSTRHHYKHLGKLLSGANFLVTFRNLNIQSGNFVFPGANFGCVVDLHDLYGHLHSAHLSGLVVPTKKGKYYLGFAVKIEIHNRIIDFWGVDYQSNSKKLAIFARFFDEFASLKNNFVLFFFSHSCWIVIYHYIIDIRIFRLPIYLQTLVHTHTEWQKF